MPTELELQEKIKALEQQITKWKFKFNSKNAEYILLWNEFEEHKKKRNYWPWLLTLILASLTLYFYLNYEKNYFGKN